MENSIIGTILIGALSSIIAAFFVWFFTQMINISAKRQCKDILEHIDIYVSSMCNDLIWGAEDEYEPYYSDIIMKAGFLLLYIQNINSSIKCLTFGKNRKHILEQIKEIEKFALLVLGSVVGSKKTYERISRLKELYISEKCFGEFIPIRRCEMVKQLINGVKYENALEMVCIADTERDRNEIKNRIRKGKNNDFKM